MRRLIPLVVLTGILLAAPAVAAASGVTWKNVQKVNGSAGVNAIACPSASLCVAAGYDSVAVTRSPTGGKSTWKRYVIDRTLNTNDQRDSITAVGCVSAAACVVGDDNQNGWFSSSPQSGAWDPFEFPYETFVTVEAIGCSPLGNCTALSVDNHAMSTTDLGAASAWSFVQLPGTNPNSTTSTNLASVSCPSHTCVLARSTGDVYVTTDAGVTWKAVRIAQAKQVDSVDCVTASFCIAGAFEGTKHVWISRNPATASSWKSISRFAKPDDSVSSVACATTTRCLVGTAAATVYSSTAPTKTGSWTRDRVEGKGFGGFNEISCAGAKLCAAIDQFGDVSVARF